MSNPLFVYVLYTYACVITASDSSRKSHTRVGVTYGKRSTNLGCYVLRHAFGETVVGKDKIEKVTALYEF